MFLGGQVRERLVFGDWERGAGLRAAECERFPHPLPAILWLPGWNVRPAGLGHAAAVGPGRGSLQDPRQGIHATPQVAKFWGLEP